MKKNIIITLLLLIFTSTTLFAEKTPSAPSSRLSNITTQLASIFDLDENDIIGSVGNKIADSLKSKISSMAMSWLSEIVGHYFPVATIFSSIFGNAGDGENNVMQQNFDKVISLLEQNQDLIETSTTEILSAVYKSYLAAEVWNTINTVTDSLDSSVYDANKYNWTTLNLWDANRNTLSDLSKDTTNAVNAWENAQNIHNEAKLEQYKTFLAYINAVSMEIYTNMEYKNVLGAESDITGPAGGDVAAGLDLFQDRYENYFNTTIKPALGYIVRNAYSYISSLDSGWRNASDLRFSTAPDKTSYYQYHNVLEIDTSSAEKVLVEAQNYIGSGDILYNELSSSQYKGSFVIAKNDPTHDFIKREIDVYRPYYRFIREEYKYDVNGNEMNIVVCKIADNKNYYNKPIVRTLIAVPFNFHGFAAFKNINTNSYSFIRSKDGYFIYDQIQSAAYNLDTFYGLHKDIEYINYLQKGLEPALHTMDGWYKLISDTRSSLPAENHLNSYYSHFTWNVLDHSTIITNYTAASNVVVNNGAVLSILNGGGMTYGDYLSLCELLEISTDSEIINSFLSSTTLNRAGSISIPMNQKLTVKKGGTLIIPAVVYSSLQNSSQLVVESGAEIIKLDNLGQPPEKPDPAVIMTIINTILLD